MTPEECVVVLIDHQPFQFANLHSHEPTMIINNVVGFAKFAKAFKVPVIVTTILAARGGKIIKGIQDIFPDRQPIDRTYINAWQDQRIVDSVKATGRKKLVLAALWAEMCLAVPAIHALGEGYDVYVVTDASGGHLGRNVKHPVMIPSLGPVESVTATGWLNKAGDRVARDENVASIGTEKSSVDIEAPMDGILEIAIAAGPELVSADAVLGYVDDGGG